MGFPHRFDVTYESRLVEDTSGNMQNLTRFYNKPSE